MSSNLITKNQKDFKFISLNPPQFSIDISKNKVMKKTIEVKNLMVFPIILKIRSSDSKAFEVTKKTMKLFSKNSGKLEIVINTKILSSKKNLRPENLFIFFESEVLEYKYPIIVFQNSENETYLNTNQRLVTVNSDIEQKNKINPDTNDEKDFNNIYSERQVEEEKEQQHQQ